MQTPNRASMRIRLRKIGLAGVETSCEKNGSVPSVAALLSLDEIVNCGKYNISSFHWIRKRIAVVLIAAIETGEILFHG